ncbi:MAG: iron-containing alcohol dehydrogenase [Deltaproteobacteria bacterium]|nr:iron-containing alcohol dehydrogenase [Deltaproteobacteria bacterium]
MPAADPITLLLAGQYPDPETGESLAAESYAVVIEDSLSGSEADLIEALGVGKCVAVVSDRSTYEVLGERIERALRGRFTVQSIMLEAGPHAEEDTVDELVAALAPATDLVIAVGSGTINDLTKLTAFRHGCAQAVFATAPSMNGYTSLSASITSGGIKRSFRTRTPLGVYFDLRVLAAAPPRLIRAGLGDSACRPTAQADWLLSHLLLDTPYREAPFALLAEDERHLFSNTAALLAGDLETMRHLVRILVLSGFGMTICNGSYPASQGEHLLSHYVEMMKPPGLPHTFHGEQIAACTVAMAEIQERVLDGAAPRLRPAHVDRRAVVEHFGAPIGEACWREFALKQFDLAALEARLVERWDAIRTRIRGVTVGAAKLRGLLADAGAPVDPRQLGWPAELFEDALVHAREIRSRYTFLDLAADCAPR